MTDWRVSVDYKGGGDEWTMLAGNEMRGDDLYGILRALAGCQDAIVALGGQAILLHPAPPTE